MSSVAIGSGSSGAAKRVWRSALILAGAAAKGPFAAGALGVLANHREFEIHQVIGASSGALNGAVFAAGLRAGKSHEAAALLEELWRDRASFPRIALASSRKRLICDALLRFRSFPTTRAVRLVVMGTSLPGIQTSPNDYVTSEKPFEFTEECFQHPEWIDRIAEACVASAALPPIFAPRQVDGNGPYWDGGIVNNAPIGQALKGDPELECSIVITPEMNQTFPKRYGRFSGLPRLLDILINERLARDLHTARSFNQELLELDRNGVSLATLRSVVGWRLLQFLEVRPQSLLPGNLISGFLSRSLRQQYLKAGSAAADQIVNEWQPEVFLTRSVPHSMVVPAAQDPDAPAALPRNYGNV